MSTKLKKKTREKRDKNYERLVFLFFILFSKEINSHEININTTYNIHTYTHHEINTKKKNDDKIQEQEQLQQTEKMKIKIYLI